MSKIMCGVVFLCFVCSFATAQQVTAKDIVGDWEGESLCTIRDSPCHDEHVVYHFTKDEKDPSKLAVSANKIVNGEELYMGTLQCSVTQSAPQLHCSFKKDDHWDFTITGDEMKGTLVIPDNKLYRKISVKRKK